MKELFQRYQSIYQAPVIRGLFESSMLIEESAEADEAISILKKTFGFTDETIVKESGVTYKLLVPAAERLQAIDEISKLDGFEYDPNDRRSSIGIIKYGKIKFLIKPIRLQGRGSAGLLNEDKILKKIEEAIENGIKKIKIVSPEKTILVSNVSEVEHTGYNTASGKKADLIIKGTKTVSLSIKQDNAEMWESADTRFKSLVEKLVEKIKLEFWGESLIFKPFLDVRGHRKPGIFTMWNREENRKVTGVIVTNISKKDTKEIVFGSDNAVVIYRTFKETDFHILGNTLTIHVSKIIEDLTDVKKHNIEPVLKIRHDATGTSMYGLRPIVYTKKAMFNKTGEFRGNVRVMTQEEIME